MRQLEWKPEEPPYGVFHYRKEWSPSDIAVLAVMVDVRIYARAERQLDLH